HGPAPQRLALVLVDLACRHPSPVLNAGQLAADWRAVDVIHESPGTLSFPCKCSGKAPENGSLPIRAREKIQLPLHQLQSPASLGQCIELLLQVLHCHCDQCLALAQATPCSLTSQRFTLI